MKPDSRKGTGGESKGKSKAVKLGMKARLLGVIIPVIMLVFVLIVVMIKQKAGSIVSGKSEKILNTTTESVVNEVEAWIGETLAELDTQRDTLEYFELDEAGELEYIKHTAGQNEAYPAGIYVATTEGKLLHASFVPGPEFNVFEKPWYTDGIESDKFMLGSVYFDEDSQSYVVGASGMLKGKEGTVRGVAAADIYLNKISEIVKQIQLEQSGGMFLVDLRTGTVIGHKEDEIVGTVLGEQEDGMYGFVKEKTAQKSTGLFRYSEGNKETYVEIEEVPGSDWAAVSYVPDDEVMADLNDLSSQIILMAAAGILILILFIERMVHRTVKPVKKLNRTIASITEGDFTKDAEMKSSDEIGAMAAGMQGFIVTMRRIIGEISQISNLMHTQSSESVQVAGNLSRVSGIQAEAMQEMKHTMKDMAVAISEVAENATNLSQRMSSTQEKGQGAMEQMETAVSVSASGRKEMEQVLVSMGGISKKIDTLEQSAEQMGESIGEINSIVTLIRDIAEETNLLSLNASIEAARAGEAGKGFAVVADQIGKLAQTSRDAVDNIANLTENISGQVAHNVKETKESAEAIKESSSMIHEAGESFEKIYHAISQTSQAVTEMVEQVDRVNDIAISVAGITEEQSAASQEVLATTENIRENAESVLESSREVEQQAKQSGENAGRMEEHMSRFKI